MSLSSLLTISIFLLDEKFQCDINQGDHSRTSFIEEKLGNVKQIKLYYRFLCNILRYKKYDKFGIVSLERFIEYKLWNWEEE